ncbi:periplasmic binding protein-like II [Piromyces finnis]|uniref:Periplasmic binding protein-like II n=1 Tax=Piromyces finnis TaxID=1754191 RepID=A0A1Y1VKN6_9FUNG|nr:periplasmic binding protein-like II [Piromyces finnis]|eukprot:ORX58641.1 periplasmic binding protein-like II [Piromyces finnis]
MDLINIIFLIFIQFIYRCQCEKILLNSIVLSSFDNDQIYKTFVSKFNKYAIKHNFDVELSLTQYSNINSSVFIDHHGSALDYLLNKSSQKYDIVFYDIMNSQKYSPYLVDLKEYLPEDHISNYVSSAVADLCIDNDRWIGLPIHVGYDVIYANMNLLQKYNKDVPKTWDELIEIGKYIKEKENDDNLIIYNGLFPNDETALFSAQEFIYSFRDSKDAPFPNYSSKEAVKALKTMKKIKDEIASDEIFYNNDIDTVSSLINGNALFLKYWNINFENEVYKAIPLFGKKEGVSGSCVKGASIGINTFITEKRKKISAEIIKYMTHVNIQKKLVKKHLITSAIPSVYEDEKVCRVVDCELIKSIQPMTSKNSLFKDYDEYSNNFRKYLYQYLYDDRDAEDVLYDIGNISEMHYATAKYSKSTIGFTVHSISILFLFLLTYTAIFVYLHQNSNHFDFMNSMGWLCTILGLGFHVFLLLSNFGIVTVLKCHFNKILLSFGYTLFYVPFLYYLILNFPERLQLKVWLQKNKTLFYLTFISFDLVMNGFSFLTPYTIKSEYFEKGINYNFCAQEHTLGKMVNYTMLTEKIIITLVIAFLLYEEWNVKDTEFDVGCITSTLTLDTIFYSLYLVVNSMMIKDFDVFFFIHSMLLSLLFITNFSIIYGIKIVLIFMKRDRSSLNNKNRNMDSIISTSNVIDFCGEDEFDEDYTNNILYRQNNKNSSFFKRWKSNIQYYHLCKKIPMNCSISQEFSTTQIMTVN